MINELKISYRNKAYIQSEFEINRPYEACGLLIGTIYIDIANVEKVQPITNIRRSKVSFELEHIEFYNAWNTSEKEGKNIIGVYHTHPFSSATPSMWDRETMETNSLVWLIAGVDGMKSYIWDNGIRSVKNHILVG